MEMARKIKIAKIAAILWVLVVLGGLPAQADMTPIELTVDALGLTPLPGEHGKINYEGNNSYVEADRAGQLITSTDDNVGSVLYIQSDGNAGQSDRLVTVTARSHLDVQDNLPDNYDIHAGVITLTAGGTGSPSDQGLGVRAFAIDTNPDSPNYGRRYDDGSNESFRMEGSKEVSGGVDYIDWEDFAAGNPIPPKNSPPHVDEDVKFDFNNDLFYVAADSVTVLLTKIKAGDDDLFDLALDLTINLTDGTPPIFQTYDYLSDAPAGVFSVYEVGTTIYPDVIQVDFGALGFDDTDLIDYFIIGARDDPADDPKGTDEHFLINGFTADVELVPVPGAVILGVIGLGFTSWLGRRKFS